MKLYTIITAIFLLSCMLSSAQQIEIQVVYNNTADINANAETINKIKSAVKTSELQTALNSNGHITDKNLVIRVAFFDRGVIGQLKLKAEHELTPEKYIEKWQKTVSKRSGVLFLFVKDKGGSQYTLHKMIASQQLEKEHLFPLVTEFINENLSGEFTAIIGNGTKYLAKAITPVWNETKKSSAESLISQLKYGPNKINTEFNFSYFDFRPSTASEMSDMKLVNCMDKAKGKDGASWFISNKYIYTNTTNLGGLSSKSYYEWNMEIDEDVSGSIILYDYFLYQILKYIDDINKHNAAQNASQWSWAKGSTLIVTDFSGFIDRISTHRLIMFENDEYRNKEGEEISILSSAFNQTTWCNVYARDLAYKVLFPELLSKSNAPWGSHDRASGIQDKILTSSEFKEVNFDQAWKYTNAGFVVYLTSYNRKYYSGNTSKIHPGHIATCYPMESYVDGSFLTAKVIQAGSSCGVLNFGSVWASQSYGENKENVKANIYLGYIIK